MGNKYNSVEDYFAKNKKFFNDGNSNVKKAFFLLGRYRKSMANAEKYYVEKGEENGFQIR